VIKTAKKYYKELKKGNRFDYLWIVVLAVFLLSFNAFPHSTLMPVNKGAPWVIFYSEDIDNSNVLRNDFINQGWQIQTKVRCEARSEAKESWDKFKGEYRNNPAICIMNKGQTPIYWDNSYYWSAYVVRQISGSPTILSKEAGKWYSPEERVYGNNGAYWSEDDVALVTFNLDGTRPVIMIWSGDRFDTGDLSDIIMAWRWVAVFGAQHDKDWYIFNEQGMIIDSQIIITDQPDDPNEPIDSIEGNNPETNPMLSDPDINENLDDMDEEIPYVDTTQPEYEEVSHEKPLISTLVFMELVAIIFLIGGGAILLIKHKKKIKKAKKFKFKLKRFW
jgi:hypothetical protein